VAQQQEAKNRMNQMTGGGALPGMSSQATTRPGGAAGTTGAPAGGAAPAGGTGRPPGGR